MHSKIAIRKYSESDKEKIVTLLQSAFGTWPKLSLKCSPEEYWEWKYANTSTNQELIQVAGSENKLIGCAHSVISRIKLYEDVFLCSLGGDVAVDSEYRQQGLWKEMLKQIKNNRIKAGIKYNYLITKNPAVISHFKRREDYNLFPIKILDYVIIEDLDLQLKKIPVKNPLIAKYGYNVLQIINKIFHNSKEDKENIKVVMVEKFPEEINDFYNEVSESYDYIIERNMDYLNWRYCDIRGGNYKVYLAIKKDEIVGYISIIINEYNNEYPIGYISDLLVKEKELAAGDYLIKEALRYFKENNVNIVNFLTVEGSRNESLIKGNGFVNSMQQIGFYYSYLGDESIKDSVLELKPEKIHISWGDIDTLPTSPK
jgi:N-acetylglutamate synthase-like GNAT family acetyltransferase